MVEEVSAYTLDVNKSYSIRHINYGASRVSTGFMGIIGVDKKIDIMSITDPQIKKGEVTLRAVLYKLKLQDNSSLVGEMHQSSAMNPVDVVIGNTEQASKMIGMMDKNVAAYLFYVMPEQGIDKGFIKTFLSKTVDPSLIAGIDNCTWDKTAQTLRTPKDEEAEEQKNVEDSAWYNSDYVAQLAKKQGIGQ